MKLYATVTSERASKGQGGEWLQIRVTNADHKVIFEAEIKNDGVYATTFGKDAQCIDTEITGTKGERHDPRTCENSVPCMDCAEAVLKKGEKQKGEKCTIKSWSKTCTGCKFCNREIDQD